MRNTHPACTKRAQYLRKTGAGTSATGHSKNETWLNLKTAIESNIPMKTIVWKLFSAQCAITKMVNAEQLIFHGLSTCFFRFRGFNLRFQVEVTDFQDSGLGRGGLKSSGDNASILDSHCLLWLALASN
ncbi:MAG: hypothetical protein ACYDDO_10785 [Acidiferrobacterales bacterium]